MHQTASRLADRKFQGAVQNERLMAEGTETRKSSSLQSELVVLRSHFFREKQGSVSKSVHYCWPGDSRLTGLGFHSGRGRNCN